MDSAKPKESIAGRVALAILFVIAGVMHFIIPQPYLRIMPPWLPAPSTLINMSGAAEILGGFGLLLPATRRLAAWGLVALLIAVLPANIYTATAHLPLPGLAGKGWLQGARIPLQAPLIYWAWLYTRV
jgi:uncharacterized membrane protein